MTGKQTNRKRQKQTDRRTGGQAAEVGFRSEEGKYVKYIYMKKKDLFDEAVMSFA